MARLLAPRLVLLCGLPGAGKTTLANQLQDSIPAIRLCPDEWIAALDFPSMTRRDEPGWKHCFGNSPRFYCAKVLA